MTQASMSDNRLHGNGHGLRVEAVRGWRDVVRDLFYDTALAILWLVTLWMLIMDVIAS